MVYIGPDEMRKDIAKMLIVIRALTPTGSGGETMLTEWIEKYHEEKED